MTKRQLRELRQRAATAASQIVARAQSENSPIGSRVAQDKYDELQRVVERKIVEVAKAAKLPR